ncbi:unnamed protein product [Protopolystoma xenopodis]|uniref:Uncharacterized protein n=1 Tax=Protopolystoma xenopodis TaxID=117903 RepID=A0A3S5BU48_9PLAT|nr:unnamed protein product [Protopolystoma xenopodis]
MEFQHCLSSCPSYPPLAPFTACDPKQAYATGRGIQPQGVRVRDLADFKVHTEEAGEGQLETTVLDPGEAQIHARTHQIYAFLFYNFASDAAQER